MNKYNGIVDKKIFACYNENDASIVNVGDLTSMKVFQEVPNMKWKEMSAFHRAATIVCWLCGAVYITLSILEVMHILSDTHTVARIFLNILCLSYGALSLKNERSMAIFCFVFGGSGLLLNVIYLFI